MIRTSLFLTALLSASIAYAGDPSITLSGQDGTVLVNSGKQFISAHAGQTLAPGDRILVMKGGKATLSYPNGCVSTVNPGSLVDVSAHCAQNVAQTRKIGPMYAQAVGDTSDHAVGDTSDHRNCERERPDGTGDDCGPPPLWPEWAAFVAIACVTLVCRQQHRHETVFIEPPPISTP